MKLYDVNTDTFLTERSDIVDNIVRDAGLILTFSHRMNNADTFRPAASGPLESFLRKALADTRERLGLRHVVSILWDAQVHA